MLTSTRCFSPPTWLLLAALGLGTRPAAAQILAHHLPPAVALPGCPAFSGYVLSAGQPVAGASVYVKDAKLLLITNQLGYFLLPATVTDFPTLDVTAAGYTSQTVTLSQCDPVNIELTLLPNSRIKRRGKRKGQLIIKKVKVKEKPADSPPLPAAEQQ